MVFDKFGKFIGKGTKIVAGDPEVIKWPDHLDPRSYVAWRYPKNEIRIGSVLIVNEAQKALFFRDGKLMGVIDAGRHFLDTQNVPFLQGLVTGLYGESIFKADVVFVNLLRYQDQLGGRAFIDWIGVHLLYNATYYYTVDENRLETFYTRVMGTSSEVTSDDIREMIAPIIDSTLRDALAEYATEQARMGRTIQNVSDFMAMLNEFSDYVKARISQRVNEMFGIAISELVLRLDISDEDKRILQMSGPRAFAAMYEREWMGREKIAEKLSQGQGSAGTAAAVAPFIMMPWMMYPPPMPPAQQQMTPPQQPGQPQQQRPPYPYYPYPYPYPPQQQYPGYQYPYPYPPQQQQPYPPPQYPPQQQPAQQQQPQQIPQLVCPYCGRPIPYMAPVCPHCAKRIKWCPDGRPVKEEDNC